MKRLLNYDPLTGVANYHDYDHSTGLTHYTAAQDVNPYLKMCKELRNDKDFRRHNLKGDNNYLYAIIPATIQTELILKHGIDVNNQDDWPKMDKIMASDYPAFLTVNKI